MLAGAERGEATAGLVAARLRVGLGGHKRDQAPGDGRREHAVTGVDELDGPHDVGRRRVLEEEPAAPARRARTTSSSASKVVRIRTSGGRGRACSRRVAGDPVELRHADVHEHHVRVMGLDGLEDPATVIDLPDDLDLVATGEGGATPGASR